MLGCIPRLSRLAILIGFLAPVAAQAFSVKSFSQASKGCIPLVTGEKAKEALGKFNIRTSNATAIEARSLGTALVWIAALNHGEPLEKAIGQGRTGYTYRFASNFGSSHQATNEVLINRNGGRNYGQNVAQLVHELGHFIGNNGGYDQYRRAMQGHYCDVSSYSNSRFNEQFAEVFAAFLTQPKLIKNNSSKGCRLAYQFFSKQLFTNGLLAERCATSALRAGVDY